MEPPAGGFALAVAGIGLLLTRTGLEPVAVFAVVGSAILIACLAVLCAGAAFVSIWQTGRKGVGRGLAGLALALVLLAYPTYLAVQAIALPVLNDISTDIDDPPAFSFSARRWRRVTASARPSPKRECACCKPIFIRISSRSCSTWKATKPIRPC